MVEDGVDAPRVVTDGNGTYRRDPDGVWRYVIDGTEVPGAADLTLAQLYAPALVDGDRLIVRDWVKATPGHPLLWVLEHADPTSPRAPVRVPDELWGERAGQVVAMVAPELHPTQLIGMDELAERAGLARATVRSHLHRNTLPPPVARIAGSPAWSRPVVERWLAGRLRRG
jgi:predicted DNA-binding transcriptional regulator AlpA